MRYLFIAGAAILALPSSAIAQDAVSTPAQPEFAEERPFQANPTGDNSRRIAHARKKHARIKAARIKQARKKHARIKHARLKHKRIKLHRIKLARRKAAAGR